MSNLAISIILSLIAGLSTILGCIFLFFNIKKKKEFITFSMALSLAVMIFISIFDLIPESIKLISNQNIFNYIKYFVVLFIIGVLLVKAFEIILEKNNNSSLYKIGILSFAALMLHNLPEGILTFMSAYQDFHLGVKVCFAIAMHNIPEGISIAVPIYYSTKNKKKAFKTVLISSLAEPLGAILTYLLLKDIISNKTIGGMLIIVSGIMICLSIENLLPEAKKLKKIKYLYLGIVTGLIISILSILI